MKEGLSCLEAGEAGLFRPWSSGQVDEGEPAQQAGRTARAEAWNLECAEHVEGMGPAGDLGDDGGTGRDQTEKGENRRPSQHSWSFIQLAEKGQKCFVEVSQ